MRSRSPTVSHRQDALTKPVLRICEAARLTCEGLRGSPTQEPDALDTSVPLLLLAHGDITASAETGCVKVTDLSDRVEGAQT
jgi:hypothetical protein